MQKWFDDPGEKNLATGMHRVCPAQNTIDKILKQKHRFGITRLANITGLDRVGVPVALAIRPNSRSVAVSQGKGMTLDHAKASALMESVEIWHAETFDKPLIYSSFADLSDRHSTINVGRLPETNNVVFTDTLRMLWAESFELNSGETRLVPYDMIHTDYTDAEIPGHGCVPCSTNGLASGNHILEAICHGICEVIERDALSVWEAARKNGTKMRRVAASSVEDTDCEKLLALFATAHLDCYIWDMTTDIGIATFTVVIREQGGVAGHLGLGSGAHLDRGIALRRALTEAAQTRLNYTSGSRDDLMAAEYATEGVSRKNEAFEDLVRAPSDNTNFSGVPTRTNSALRDDLDHLLAHLNSIGIEEVGVIDLTREAIAIPVVRVIIPGLEAPHDDSSYVPGQRARELAI